MTLLNRILVSWALVEIFCGSAAFHTSQRCVSLPTRHNFKTGSTSQRHRFRSISSGAGSLKALANGDIDFTIIHQVITGLADAASTTADPAADGGGIFGSLVTLTENAIVGLHDFLRGMGVENSYGLAIIGFTLFIKAITFPLTYQQLSSTTKMQTLQPKVKDIQKRLGNNPEAANKAIAELYKEEKVNPLSGCLPSLAQIPIFISLYRALLHLAKEDKLAEPFLWLPSLEGPVFQAPPTESLDWIKKWVDGAPPLGWHDTLCYLTIPVILVITQSISQQLMSPPKKPDAEADTSQAILKYLPLLIGWFSLNVPSGLGLYWIVNNFVSTAASVLIRNQLGVATSIGAMTGFSPSDEIISSNDEPLEFPVSLESDAKGFGPQSISEVDGEIIPANDSIKPKKSSSSGKKKKNKRSNR